MPRDVRAKREREVGMWEALDASQVSVSDYYIHTYEPDRRLRGKSSK
jgi:hypothetical protein